MEDAYDILNEIFTNKSEAVIRNVIRIVEHNADNLSSEEQLEAMINLLSETGTSDASSDGPFDEAVAVNAGPSEDPVTVTLKRLLDILPDADPSYLEQHAPQLTQSDAMFEDFINIHIETKDYPKLEDYIRYEIFYYFPYKLYSTLLGFLCFKLKLINSLKILQFIIHKLTSVKLGF